MTGSSTPHQQDLRHKQQGPRHHQQDLRHHGDAETGAGLLDLAVNVLMPGPPDWLRVRFENAMGTLGAYPDPRAATRAVAARHGRDEREVLLTAGAAEAFVLLARVLRPRRAVVVHPSFTEPEAALRAAGADVEHVLLPYPFDLDPGLVPDDADLVVLGNPTNPTSRLHLARDLAGLARPGRTLVVDEAFMDATDEAQSLSAARLPGLVVVRSLTKTWGLAGLRVGYLLADAALVLQLREAQPLWSVGSLGLVALEACSEGAAVAWAQHQAQGTAARRDRYVAALQARGVDVVEPAAGPFLLVRSDAHDRLREQGIAVRRCDTFPGLDGTWLRSAIPAEADLEAVAAAVAGEHYRRPALEPATKPHPVVLVGAGPGAADLVTLRARRVLHEAEVVVHDRLVDPELLVGLHPAVLVLDAGKAPGNHRMVQEHINATLVEHGLAGRRVVRLKGGDPFVFGRGSEEVLACVAAGLTVEVVPGLTSAVAVPTLAGVPVTHRGATQAFTVVSGHVRPGDPASTVDWAQLAAGGHTLVLMMAVGTLPAICRALLAGGRDPATPVVCVQQGSSDATRTIRTTLGRAEHETVGLENPAVTVVGTAAGVLHPDV